MATAGQRSWDLDEQICWVAPRAGGDGYLAGLRQAIAELDVDPLRITPLAALDADRPNNRLNDAKVDSLGRIWAGSMDDLEQDFTGSLFRIDRDRSIERVDTGYCVANGPAFSPRGDTLYHTDSARRTVWRFALGPDGALGERRVFVTFRQEWGYPDGMTTDAEGGVWIAHWDGGRVSRFSPDGVLDRSIALPVSRVTSCAFAGEEYRRLFVTTAAIGRPDEPLAGGLFELDPGVAGLPSALFGG